MNLVKSTMNTQYNRPAGPPTGSPHFHVPSGYKPLDLTSYPRTRSYSLCVLTASPNDRRLPTRSHLSVSSRPARPRISPTTTRASPSDLPNRPSGDVPTVYPDWVERVTMNRMEGAVSQCPMYAKGNRMTRRLERLTCSVNTGPLRPSIHPDGPCAAS